MFPTDGWDSPPIVGWENPPGAILMRRFLQFCGIGTLLD
jgi:hypothetical protein